MQMMRTAILSIIAMSVLWVLAGCSTDFWYTQVQGHQYDKCEKLTSPDDRRRCKAETSVPKEKYDKERQGTGKT